MSERNSLQPIPRFVSEDEERELWATHDSTDHVDWSRAQPMPRTRGRDRIRPGMAVQTQERPFTAAEYERMESAGILGEDDRVELIDGQVLEMAAIGNRHTSCVRRLLDAFTELVGREALIDVQNPIRLGDLSQPQPDLALLRRREDYYEAAPPGSDDILLLVEVADASLAFDRERKIPLYGRSGITEVWLVDLTTDAVEVYSEPGPAGYRSQRRLERGESLTLLAFPGLLLPVDGILGRG